MISEAFQAIEFLLKLYKGKQERQQLERHLKRALLRELSLNKEIVAEARKFNTSNPEISAEKSWQMSMAGACAVGCCVLFSLALRTCDTDHNPIRANLARERAAGTVPLWPLNFALRGSTSKMRAGRRSRIRCGRCYRQSKSGRTAMSADHYTCCVTWSVEDQEYVGLCTELPSLTWLAATPEAALTGIRTLVHDAIDDLRANNERVPEPLAER